MSRQNVYNPILRILQKQRLASFRKNSPKLILPASSKEEFFTLKRNYTKKSLYSLKTEQHKINRSHDRNVSIQYTKPQFQTINISQELYINTSTDDDMRTTITKSYDTHEENQNYPNLTKKKKNTIDIIEVNKTAKDMPHKNNQNLKCKQNDQNLKWRQNDYSVQNPHNENQFSNIFLNETPVKKQKSSKHEIFLKFKQNIKKKHPLSLKIKHFLIFPKPLGQGTYSKVYKAIHKKTGIVCAIKVIEKQKIIEQNLIDNLIQQIRIMCLCEHPNIAKLWGFFDEGPKFYMVMEYCTDGQLYKLIKNFDQKQEYVLENYTKKIDLIKQICMAIEFLHGNSVMHRDIKPQNILLTMGDNIKISDFGWARIIHNPSQELRKTLCGTPLYLAPQRIKQTQYSKSVDLWAIGILTYQLLTGKIPFTIETIQDLHKIVNEDVSFEEIRKFPYAVDFVRLLLEKDGFKRSEAHKLIEHQFLNFEMGFNEKAFIYELQFGKVL